MNDPLFEQWYLENRASILQYLTVMLGSHEDAEDAVQVTFFKAWRAWREKTPEQRAQVTRAWFNTIAIHAGLDLLRRRKLIAWSPIEKTSEHFLASRERDPQESYPLRDAIMRTIAQLRTHEQQVFLLWCNDVSYAEMSALTGDTVATLKTRMMRARDHFQQKYRGQGA